MKILVTGGAGFIGSHLCDLLLEAEHEVTAYDNLSLGRLSNIGHVLETGNFHFIKGEILDKDLFHSVMKEGAFDCVFHMAANSDIARSHTSPSIDLDNTFLTTFSVLEAMRIHGPKKLVFASTSAIYGEAKGRVAESHGPLQPISHYGAAKLASEAFIASYCENYAIQSWITRFPNVVGSRSTHGALHDFVARLRNDPSKLDVLGDGTQEKPYLHVSDLVRAILFVWGHSDKRFNAYNVGTDTRTTVADIARIVIEEGGLTSRICYSGGSRGWIGDVPKFEYDTRALNELGWKPRMSSDEAVRMSAREVWEQPQ